MKKNKPIEPDTHDQKPPEKLYLTLSGRTLAFHVWDPAQLRYDTLLTVEGGPHAERVYRACRTKSLRFSV